MATDDNQLTEYLQARGENEDLYLLILADLPEEQAKVIRAREQYLRRDISDMMMTFAAYFIRRRCTHMVHLGHVCPRGCDST